MAKAIGKIYMDKNKVRNTVIIYMVKESAYDKK